MLFPTDMNRMPWLLSLAGFVPFAALALALVYLPETNPLHPVLVDAFRTYSAVILSFLGGIRWGAEIGQSRPSLPQLSLSVLPAIVGWAALLAGPVPGLAVLLLAYCGQGAWDSIAFHRKPETVWFARLRIVLTLLVVAAHIAAMLGLG